MALNVFALFSTITTVHWGAGWPILPHGAYSTTQVHTTSPLPDFSVSQIHTQAHVYLDAKEHQNIPKANKHQMGWEKLSKALTVNIKIHWWVWGLYPLPSSFYIHPISSEEWENRKDSFQFCPCWAIIKYGDGARGGWWWWWKALLPPLFEYQYLF